MVFQTGGTDVLVDSKSSIASERDGILQSVGGMACKYDELISKKKDEGREFVKDKRFFYIYHNTVDSVGDDGKTEGHTFEAVRRAIDELAAIVNYIVNSLNGNHVVVTADLSKEVIEILAQSKDIRIERIVSFGQSSPDGFWYDQDQAEWIMVFLGEAKLLLEGDEEPIHMTAGDHLTIPSHQKHRVEWTMPDAPTIWLAVFYSEADR